MAARTSEKSAITSGTVLVGESRPNGRRDRRGQSDSRGRASRDIPRQRLSVSGTGFSRIRFPPGRHDNVASPRIVRFAKMTGSH
ncbi:MAG: hypothetical protein AMS20_02955, partial [Gemmatimonas sp. SG8_28]